jgi:hypothetical protein
LFGPETAPLARPYSAAVEALISPTPPLSGLGAAVAGLFPLPSTRPFGALAGPPPVTPTTSPKPVAPAVKRRAFFSFHYDDSIRVNVVRNAWKITHRAVQPDAWKPARY